MYSPLKIISENPKTGASINLPLDHCAPTKLCKMMCYAKSGPIALPVTKRKQKYVSDYLTGNDITQLIHECFFLPSVRLNGSGDLLKKHVSNIIQLASTCLNTMFYGMTRKPYIAEALNNKLPNLKFLLSVDASTSKKLIKDYTGTICFGPRRACDKVPKDKRIVVVFPYHCHGTVIQGIPKHSLDCPAVRHEVNGCHECKRCWNW